MKASLALIAILALAAGYFLSRSSSGPGDFSDRFVLHGVPRDVPDLRFVDGDLQAVSLADFGGRTVLLNLWAIWCAPCVEEMPTLDALQAELGGPEFEVVALSIDTAGVGVVRDFYREIGVRELSLYVDPSAGATLALQAVGLPTTLLIDPEGREIGRLIGPAEWSSPQAIAFLGGFVKQR